MIEIIKFAQYCFVTKTKMNFKRAVLSGSFLIIKSIRSIQIKYIRMLQK